jgi:hypothetical protein
MSHQSFQRNQIPTVVVLAAFVTVLCWLLMLGIWTLGAGSANIFIVLPVLATVGLIVAVRRWRR